MKVIARLMLFAAILPIGALACSYPEPASFVESIRSANSAVIIRIIEQRLAGVSEHQQRPLIEADVEIIEVIHGGPVQYRKIHFVNTPCGGVRLEVGHHYVLFTSQTGHTVTLQPADASVVSVEAHYVPGASEQNRRMPFLRSVIAFYAGQVSAESVDHVRGTFPYSAWQEMPNHSLKRTDQSLRD